MPQSFAEKIFSAKAGRPVRAGEIVSVEPDWVMSHDNGAAIAATFAKLGVPRVRYPERIVLVLDHEVPAPRESSAQNHREVRRFAAEQGVQPLEGPSDGDDIHHGICHQILVEEGFAVPGALMVGSDSHTTTYGALGALSAGIGRSEVAAIWATGSLWFMVPHTLRIRVDGVLPEWVTPKDLALAIIGRIGADGGDYHSVEFCGSTVSGLTVPGRMVLCNMAAEMGAKNGYVPPDAVTEAFLSGRARKTFHNVLGDEDAAVDGEVCIDATRLQPMVARPHTVDNTVPIEEIEGTPIDQALIGTCTNGRLEDLRAAASILSRGRVKVRTLIIPASRQVYREALDEGLIAVFLDAGAMVLNPGCGPCLGAHMGVMAPGERTFSTANRNFKGRMGCRDSEIFLGSPLSVAASALRGEITHPGRV